MLHRLRRRAALLAGLLLVQALPLARRLPLAVWRRSVLLQRLQLAQQQLLGQARRYLVCQSWPLALVACVALPRQQGLGVPVLALALPAQLLQLLLLHLLV